MILVAAAITLLGYGTLRQLELSAAALDRHRLGGQRRHAAVASVLVLPALLMGTRA